MHELSIAQGIAEIVEHHLPPGDRRRVRVVRLTVGEMAGVVADSLEFCFNAITAGTHLEGTVLEIAHVHVAATCRECGTAFAVQDSLFRCPDCGSVNVALTAGQELQVNEIELVDEAEEDP
jgi:hydrogenase nickel incorporation protein HypA/HybF